MTARLQFLIFTLMLAVFVPNNIIVPVHKLSHIVHHDDDVDVFHCHICSVTQVANTSEATPFGSPLPISKSVITLVVASFKGIQVIRSAQIRAPPILS